MPTILKTALNRFTRRNIIGEGASGVVLRVENEWGEFFAAKILHPRLATKEHRKRFQNELNFCLRNTHDNIVSVIDFGTVRLGNRDAPYYIMPIYKTTLRGLMAEKISPKEVMKFFSQILDGLEAAHLKKVVHRDLKPENILYDHKADQLVLADFGIARFTEEELHTFVKTKQSSRLANFQYAAPEQRIRGGQVDYRADIFALGLILNELFTGQIAQGTGFKTIGSIAIDFAYLDEIVERLIQQDPNKRYASIDDLKKDLLSRRNIFISRQKIDKLRNTVVPESQVDDPLNKSQ